MDNGASSLIAVVRGGKDSSSLGEFAFSLLRNADLSCTVANAQTATGQFNGHVYDPSGAAVAAIHGKSARPRERLDTNGAIQW